MSENSTPAEAQDTGETLARMAAYGGRQDKSGGGWGKLVLVIVLLIPLAAVAWVAWWQVELRTELATLRADNATLQQLTVTSANQFAGVEQRQQELDTSLQQTLQPLQQELAAANAASTAQAAQLAALESELATTRLRVNAMDAGGSPLAEAEVLLRFAQQRLALARDSAAAIELFQEADALLAEIDDPALTPVRETLARELAELQALPVVDVAALFAQLSVQAERIEDFAVVSETTAQDVAVTPAAANAADQDTWWNGVKQTLGEYFVVTRTTGDVLPQLDDKAQFQLRALMQLHIEQAKLALLRAEPELYRAALDDALSTSQRWLRSDDGSFADFVAALERLRDTQITVTAPASDQTLAALRQLSGTTSGTAP